MCSATLKGLKQGLLNEIVTFFMVTSRSKAVNHILGSWPIDSYHPIIFSAC